MNTFSNIIRYAVAVCDAEERWITVGGGTNAETGQGTGRHFKIDGEGRILAGGSAEMKGKTLKEAFSEPKTERQKIGRKFAEAGAKKFGGDEREFRNLGTKKGQADSFAREYLKSGNVPEGHLKEALVDKPANDAAANGEQNSKPTIPAAVNGGQSRASTDTNLLKTAFKKTLEDPLSNNKVFEAYKSMKGVRYNTEQWKKMREQSIEKMEKAENDYFNIDNVLDAHYKKMQKSGMTDYAKNSRKANELEEKKRKIEDDWLNALGGLALSTERLTNRKPTQKEIAQAIDRKNQEDNPALSGLKALAEEYGTNNNLQANNKPATLSSPSQNETNNKNEGSIMAQSAAAKKLAWLNEPENITNPRYANERERLIKTVEQEKIAEQVKNAPMSLHIKKRDDGRFSVKIPFALKDKFKKVFSSAEFDSKTKEWTVGSRSGDKLNQWVNANLESIETNKANKEAFESKVAEMHTLTGKTFDIKDEIKSKFGGVFKDGAWHVPSEHKEAAQAFVNEYNAKEKQSRASVRESKKIRPLTNEEQNRVNEWIKENPTDEDLMQDWGFKLAIAEGGSVKEKSGFGKVA